MDVSIVIASSSLQSLSDKLLLVFEYLLHTKKANDTVSFIQQVYLGEVKSIFIPVYVLVLRVHVNVLEF